MASLLCASQKEVQVGEEGVGHCCLPSYTLGVGARAHMCLCSKGWQKWENSAEERHWLLLALGESQEQLLKGFFNLHKLGSSPCLKKIKQESTVQGKNGLYFVYATDMLPAMYIEYLLSRKKAMGETVYCRRIILFIACHLEGKMFCSL